MKRDNAKETLKEIRKDYKYGLKAYQEIHNKESEYQKLNKEQAKEIIQLINKITTIPNNINKNKLITNFYKNIPNTLK